MLLLYNFQFDALREVHGIVPLSSTIHQLEQIAEQIASENSFEVSRAYRAAPSPLSHYPQKY